MGYVPPIQWEISHSPRGANVWDTPHIMNTETLPIRLDRLIHEDGRSRTAISLAAGLGRTAARDIIESRSKAPGYETIAAFSRVLGVTADYLTCKTNERGTLESGQSPSPPVDPPVPAFIAEAFFHASDEEKQRFMSLAQDVLVRAARQSRRASGKTKTSSKPE
jgi:hypothetical protein